MQFLHGPPGLINRTIGVGIRSRIRIGDGNPAERFTRHLAGNLSAIDPGTYGLVCPPVRWVDADGAPCRAVLVDEERGPTP